MCAETNWDVLMVCRQFRAIHKCGEVCGETVESPNGEGLVCRLTGRCLLTPIMSAITPMSNGPEKRKATPGIIKMGTVGARKRTKVNTDSADHRVRQKIEDRLKILFSSKERTNVYEHHKARFLGETLKHVRECKTYIPVMKIDALIRAKKIEYGAFLNPPPIVFTDAVKTAITSDFLAYHRRLARLTISDRFPIVVR